MIRVGVDRNGGDEDITVDVSLQDCGGITNPDRQARWNVDRDVPVRPFKASSFPLRSPMSWFTPSGSSPGCVLPRLKTVTLCPRLRAYRTIKGPVKPVPPRIRMRSGLTVSVAPTRRLELMPKATAAEVVAESLINVLRSEFMELRVRCEAGRSCPRPCGYASPFSPGRIQSGANPCVEFAAPGPNSFFTGLPAKPLSPA